MHKKHCSCERMARSGTPGLVVTKLISFCLIHSAVNVLTTPDGFKNDERRIGSRRPPRPPEVSADSLERSARVGYGVLVPGYGVLVPGYDGY